MQLDLVGLGSRKAKVRVCSYHVLRQLPSKIPNKPHEINRHRQMSNLVRIGKQINDLAPSRNRLRNASCIDSRERSLWCGLRHL